MLRRVVRYKFTDVSDTVYLYHTGDSHLRTRRRKNLKYQPVNLYGKVTLRYTYRADDGDNKAPLKRLYTSTSLHVATSQKTTISENTLIDPATPSVFQERPFTHR
jgi:hypothetical protein